MVHNEVGYITVKYSTLQYNTVVIIYDSGAIEPCNNTVGANSVDHRNVMML